MEQFITLPQTTPISGVFPVGNPVKVIIKLAINPGIPPSLTGIRQNILRTEARRDGLAVNQSTSYPQIISHIAPKRITNIPFRKPHGRVALKLS